MEILVLALAFGVACAVIANNKGRSAFGWFVLGCLFSLLALIVIACLKPAEPEKLPEDQRLCPHCGKPIFKAADACCHCGTKILPDPAGENDTKICPFCAETIKKNAVVCRFCGRDLPQAEKSEND